MYNTRIRGKCRLPVRRSTVQALRVTRSTRRLRMDGNQTSISPIDLFSRLGTAAAPTVIDVRRAVDFANVELLIPSAFHCPPEEVDRWRKDLTAGRPVAVYCVHGHEVSQSVATALREAGCDAAYLEGGIAGWIEQGLPTRRNIGASPGKWVTRER